MSKSPVETLDLSRPLRGSRLRALLTGYLTWECDQAEARNRLEVVSILKALLGDSARERVADRDWERLAEAALTIGAKALDNIESRLKVVTGQSAPGSDFDYRSAAHQIHSITNQARKLKNAVALRRKCVKAVLSSSDITNPGDDRLLLDEELSGMTEIRNWTHKLFRHFEGTGKVSSKFLATYESEWQKFSEDSLEYLAVNLGAEVYQHPGYRYEKYLQALISEAQKSKSIWTTSQNNPIRASQPNKRSDKLSQSDITIDLKRRPDHFAFLVNIPASGETNLQKAPLEIIDLLDRNSGLTSVDVLQNPHDAANLEIRIHDDYQMSQIADAHKSILEYFRGSMD